MKSHETAYNFLDLGWNVRLLSDSQIKDAVQRAHNSDLAILVVGENSMRYHWNEKTCGENSDRYELSLPGLYQPLVSVCNRKFITFVRVRLRFELYDVQI
ncbi:glycoside hydrolase family 3 C-terminal domain-containing protein [Bacteroides acidifaciens]|uniref:glycoside hydrolase family 3 C-terminal domain-containing protein n=1 Tax=Bacteroides acidifaciens TaxID=85831 RepID=UPI0020CA3FCB|nr:glycoside hydrolase family 3 C-terminal domain-containing protein [Bacteroides acidifaciens]